MVWNPASLYLVGGGPTPLKNMSSSVGMMTFPTEWKNKIHVPNHHFHRFPQWGLIMSWIEALSVDD
jgi:hypothetical protein